MEEYLQRRESHAAAQATESSKRRKLYPELEDGGEAMTAAGNSVSPAASRNDSGGSDKGGDCSSDAVKKRSSDPEFVGNVRSESLGTGVSISVSGDRVSRETTPSPTPSGELYGDSEETPLQPIVTSKKKPTAITRRKVSEKTPSAAELEEFFAAAEKYEQTRFAEKYNFDIVRDVPLEGKYQWLPLK